MKAVILAGGYGTRIGEETHLKPKPILWHIMSLFNYYGITEFIICLGYKGYAIKEFFLNYNLHMSDFTINLKDNTFTNHFHHIEPWQHVLDPLHGYILLAEKLWENDKYIDA
ncbi:hypothetical protein CY96_28905 (plasmid) [Bacillus bombysepticus str. Wang]|uniref:Glucose-1-phosphate cytidylyltransferase n=1 Tax=Bacillus bombysepticus str. Wang TaxID=1330043 RepID=A0A9W3LI66_9BACI|nr:hypothetical protein CY96_28905 [Bacillus bombysepticus str. Wang]